MPVGPAFLGDLMESAMGRSAQVLAVDRPAPGFIDLEVRADSPPGGWQPGHEVQVRVTPTTSRRYSVRTVGSSHVRILGATSADGPGAAWLAGLREGSEVTLVAGRFWPLRAHGTRRLFLGDGCSLGTIEAYVGREHLVAVEVPASAVTLLAAQWPGYHFVAAADSPGDAVQDWLVSAIADGSLSGIDGAMLLGHAQSIQRQRRALLDADVLSRRAITTKPYWSTGRRGL